MSKPTPGPWMSFDSGTMVLVEGDDDLLIASLDETEVKSVSERVANARLIAAAPELLAFVKAVLADRSAYQWHIAARKVIGKAEGHDI